MTKNNSSETFSLKLVPQPHLIALFLKNKLIIGLTYSYDYALKVRNPFNERMRHSLGRFLKAFSLNITRKKNTKPRRGQQNLIKLFPSQ